MNGFCITIRQPTAGSPYEWRVYDGHPAVHRLPAKAEGTAVDPLQAYLAAVRWIGQQKQSAGE